jgi:tRNA 2-selenouridine synthase
LIPTNKKSHGKNDCGFCFIRIAVNGPKPYRLTKDLYRREQPTTRCLGNNILLSYLCAVILSIDDFLKLRGQLPAVDVRSENEYAEGHMRGVINLPILNNKERIEVGTDYKQKGQLEAIKTGFRLVGPRIVEIVNAAERIAGGSELLVHCWRGGMRSSNFCQFVGMAKIRTHQLEGGYKAYRAQALVAFGLPLKLKIIGGFTGSGKSEILRALAKKGEQVLDLEHLANHKGSVFGGLLLPAQPTTEQFQNELFEEIMRLDATRPVWVEDESVTIGKVILPDGFWRRMCESPIVEMEVDKPVRIGRLVDEYGPADTQKFLKAMSSIVKKLGGQHFQTAKEKLLSGDMASTIDILLTYYDKAYRTGLSKKEGRITSRIRWDGNDPDTFAEKLISGSR